MALCPLTSTQVLEFLPLNTWTEVYLQPSNFKNVCFVSTYHKMEKRKKDMQLISSQSSLFHRVTQFEVLKIVAVEIEGKWFRGKLISYNEFLTDNTIIQLIDYGNVYETKLENLFDLPYYFMYEPLALPVTFKDFIPKKTTFSIKPLLSESNLHEGAVLVHVNSNDTKLEKSVDEKQLFKSKKDINSANDTKNISVKNNITNGHDNNKSSSYVSRTLKRVSFSSKEKLNNVPLKNEDYCILTYFEDFTSLYVGKAIKCDNGSYDFVDINTLLNTAKSTDQILKCNPVVGDVVKVFSKNEDLLFRAKILKNIKGCYDVFYIDYGNIETVPSNVIYELADELKKMPGIAVKIGLSDLKDFQITEQIKDMFKTFCNAGKPFMIEFNENSKNCLENVKLKDIENGSYINSKYLMKRIASQTEEFIQIPQNITENETVLINTPELEVTSNIELRTGDTVFCTHSEDFNLPECSKNNTTPGNCSSNRVSNNWQSGDHVEFLYGNNVDNIFVRNIKLYEEFKNVLDQLKEENYEHYKPIVAKPCEYVAVYSGIYRGIYRARVSMPDSDNTNIIKCTLIDFGKVDMIPSKNVFALPNYVLLNKIPTMVRRVSLSGVHKTSNINMIIQYLSSLKGKTYIMEYDKNPRQWNRHKVILKDLQSSVSLNDEIQKLY
ncbi:uncharacterized protein LOC100167801 isoform X2 [Acyrthosiphon pisum]|uniref:Tudor domain-containing protein n=1 Tax=Acyrthosiphon pisum TaxID=7029 RepID=A0A8R2JRY4_ACYPI|nr:uncharacterized protein LOC100167801 isoform X2 [Acyrthosiphon pisum]